MGIFDSERRQKEEFEDWAGASANFWLRPFIAAEQVLRGLLKLGGMFVAFVLAWAVVGILVAAEWLSDRLLVPVIGFYNRNLEQHVEPPLKVAASAAALFYRKHPVLSLSIVCVAIVALLVLMAVRSLLEDTVGDEDNDSPRDLFAENLVGQNNLQQHYVLLDLRPDCSEQELKDAWVIALQQWHPDKLEGMAPELKKLANDRLAEINNAYAALKQLARDRDSSTEDILEIY